MVFKRYSNPFSLFDNLILTNQFNSFIDTLNDKAIEDIEYECWLHKSFDKSFEEFKKEVHSNIDAQDMTMNKDEIKTTVKKSNEILSNFIPQQEER